MKIQADEMPLYTRLVGFGLTQSEIAGAIMASRESRAAYSAKVRAAAEKDNHAKAVAAARSWGNARYGRKR